MVMQRHSTEDIVEGLVNLGEDDRGRVDSDERIFGKIAQRGQILEVLDANAGHIQVLTGLRREISARITEYRYPIPRVGDEVFVTYTIDGDAIASPTAQNLPSTFTGIVTGAKGSTSPTEPHAGIVRHRFSGVSESGVGESHVLATGGTGVSMAVGDLVMCCIDYIALVAPDRWTDHVIYAVSGIPQRTA